VNRTYVFSSVWRVVDFFILMNISIKNIIVMFVIDVWPIGGEGLVLLLKKYYCNVDYSIVCGVYWLLGIMKLLLKKLLGMIGICVL